TVDTVDTVATTVVAAPRLSATAKDVPSDDSEEELSWNSFDDEDVDEQTKGREESEGDKTDESDVITLSFPSLDDQMKIKEENIEDEEKE
nr:hypothetical protein [Tanacetum cinerariifolium]